MTKYFKSGTFWIALRNNIYVTHGEGSGIMGRNLSFETFTTKAKLDIGLTELGVDMDEELVNN